MNKVEIVLLDCRSLDPENGGFERYISPLRRDKLERFTNAEAKRLSLGAELALCGALSLRGIPHTPPEYYYDDSGRPTLLSGGFISLSHSGSHAACAIADIPVGVDIEAPRKVNSNIIRRVFSDEEQPSDVPRDILAKWVVKESYLKLTGEGLRRSMTSLTALDGMIRCAGGDSARYILTGRGGLLLGCCCREEFDIHITEYTVQRIADIL